MTGDDPNIPALPIPLDQVNNDEIDKHDIHNLDSIIINLDEEYTLYDYEYEIIDLDVDLPNVFSMQLSLTFSLEHSDSQGCPNSNLTIVPIVLDISPS